MSSELVLAVAAPSGEAAKSGPWGLAVILVLCAACYFLFKSMSKHLRRVREDFPSKKPAGTSTVSLDKAAPPVDGDVAPDAIDQPATAPPGDKSE
jgi:hypothetical protein